MMSKRVMGKASFADLRDRTGDIQMYIRRDDVGTEEYQAFKKFDKMCIRDRSNRFRNGP